MDTERVDRVRRQTSAVGLIGEYTRLHRCGQRFMGRCPLHGDDQWSLFVDENKGLYFCFLCESKGDVIRFVQEADGLTLEQAVLKLEQRITLF